MLDCYRPFHEGEKDGSSEGMQEKPLVQINLLTPKSPATATMANIPRKLPPDDIPTYTLNKEEVPKELQIPLPEWSQFAESLQQYSNKFLYYKSRELGLLYFVVLIIFLVAMTVIRVVFDSFAIEGALIGLCLGAIVLFVLGFNYFPTVHDSNLDAQIFDLIVTQQPFREKGYFMDYCCENQSEGLLGTRRLVRVYSGQHGYQHPKLDQSS